MLQRHRLLLLGQTFLILILVVVCVHQYRIGNRSKVTVATAPDAETLRPSSNLPYETCVICQSIRTESPNGELSYAVRTSGFDRCRHVWRRAVSAWSARKIAIGDVILIRCNGRDSAVRVTGMSDSGGQIEYSWFTQPDPWLDGFVGSDILTGMSKTRGVIQFGDVSIPFDERRIGYDYYFGGTSRANSRATGTQLVALIGDLPIDQLHMDDPNWRFKTWENGDESGNTPYLSGTKHTLDQRPLAEEVWRRVAGQRMPDPEKLLRLRQILRDEVPDPRGKSAMGGMWQYLFLQWAQNSTNCAAVDLRCMEDMRIGQVILVDGATLTGLFVPVYRTVGQLTELTIRSQQRLVRTTIAKLDQIEIVTKSDPSTADADSAGFQVELQETNGSNSGGAVLRSESDRFGFDFWFYPISGHEDHWASQISACHLTQKPQPHVEYVRPELRYRSVTFK